jgi:hypothetical protein
MDRPAHSISRFVWLDAWAIRLGIFQLVADEISWLPICNQLDGSASHRNANRSTARDISRRHATADGDYAIMAAIRANGCGLAHPLA